MNEQQFIKWISKHPKWGNQKVAQLAKILLRKKSNPQPTGE